ncbi:hypothetical protein RRG08_003493 [Elysia crispata]|uniref:Uncharacterized protein n=1 Tax=Elysia crispata TaxID=231223 RepID=A0AAE0Y824_9GAST|nr:hypothetical protein RRG08_003493 [Elysia crispata]
MAGDDHDPPGVSDSQVVYLVHRHLTKQHIVLSQHHPSSTHSSSPRYNRGLSQQSNTPKLSRCGEHKQIHDVGVSTPSNQLLCSASIVRVSGHAVSYMKIAFAGSSVLTF